MKPQNDCLWIGLPPNDYGETDQRRPEISLRETKTGGKADDQLIMCGYVPVVLQKMFGPLIFTSLRVRANFETCEWIVERENIKTMLYEEVIRIPGQREEEFRDEDEYNP